MRALILAAGYGKRLLPLTKSEPKCLVKINNVPILKIWLDKLLKSGIKEVYINSHYLSDKVENYINTIKIDNLKITLLYENNLMGTGGTLINNLNIFFNDDLLMIHVDNYSLQNLDEFILSHQNRPNGTLMTLMTFRTKQIKNSGIIKINDNNIITSFEEKPNNSSSNLANGAIYILSKEILKKLSTSYKKNKFYNFSTDMIPKYINNIFTFETKKFFIDIGNLENLKLANKIDREKKIHEKRN